MVPIKPRRQIVYPFADLSINAPGREVLEERPLYTLYHTNRKLSMEPKIAINARIVFVGASDVCLSSLETLVFSPHLKFNNLTLVSPNGLPQTTTSPLLPNSCCFFNEALRGISLEAWVNIVPGALTAINRNSNHIKVLTSDQSEESTLPYDYLVITTGTQFASDKPQTGHVPNEGVFTISGNISDNQTIEKAKALIGNDGSIVVYGSTIASLITIHHILDQWGIAGARVTWVQPDAVSLFPSSIQITLEDVLKCARVKILQGYTFDRYETITTDQEGKDNLVGAVFIKQEYKEIDEITVHCNIMFCLETKNVDERTFKAVNDACIVYDHRIVIDSNNSTNDSHILAAGSVTKYSRFYRTEWSHSDFNSNEVGQNLATTLLSKLDPTLPPPTDTLTSSSSKRLIPTYIQPKILFTQLPGGHYYLKVDKPCLKGSSLESKEKDGGVELVTSTENGYFSLWINQYERVQTITVFSSKLFEVSNYIHLYNIHEKLLNDMLSRWKDNLIKDFFLYFREEWACAIFHDRFVEFLSEVQELLETPDKEGEKSLMEKTRDIIEDTSDVTVEYNMKKFLGLSNGLQSALHKRIRRYIHYNGYHLTMYAQPDML